MLAKKRGLRSRHSSKACHHALQYETDWVGRTYIGCPICNRWKLMKPTPAPPDGKRLAA